MYTDSAYSDGHTRVVLSKALNSSYKNVRLFTTKHLTYLLQESPTSKSWLISLLVTQLYDTSVEVRELAVSILNEVCQSLEVLELVVEMRPSLDHLGSIGAPLLFRYVNPFVSCTSAECLQSPASSQLPSVCDTFTRSNLSNVRSSSGLT